MLSMYSSMWATVNYTVKYCRFQQTFLNFTYSVVDSSRADWRDFTFTSALTASASCSNLKQIRWQQHLLHFRSFFLSSSSSVLLMHNLPVLCLGPGFFLFFPFSLQLLDFLLFLLCLRAVCVYMKWLVHLCRAAIFSEENKYSFQSPVLLSLFP